MFFNYAGISLVTTTSHIYSTRAEQNGSLYALSVDVFMFVMLPHDHRRYIDLDPFNLLMSSNGARKTQ